MCVYIKAHQNRSIDFLINRLDVIINHKLKMLTMLEGKVK